MNAWIIRLLGGAACTAGALAFGVGIAQAQEPHHLPVDVRAVVSVVTGGHHHSTASTGNRVAEKRTFVKASSAAHVGVPTGRQLGLITRTTVGGQHHGSVRTAPAAHHRVVREDTLIAAVTVAPRPARPAASAVKGDARATVRHLDAVACVRVNAGRCGTGQNPGAGAFHTGDRAAPLPRVVSDTELVVVDIPVSACVRINAGGCGTEDAGSAPVGNPTPPVVGGDATATVGTIVDGTACLRINGGDCGSSTGSGTGPVNPGPGSGTDPTQGGGTDNPGHGSDHHGRGLPRADGARSGSAALTADAGTNGQDSSLAHTGAGAGLLPALLIGLLALLASAPLLRRRRNG
jgi:hypothetical protein